MLRENCSCLLNFSWWAQSFNLTERSILHQSRNFSNKWFNYILINLFSLSFINDRFSLWFYNLFRKSWLNNTLHRARLIIMINFLLLSLLLLLLLFNHEGITLHYIFLLLLKMNLINFLIDLFCNEILGEFFDVISFLCNWLWLGGVCGQRLIIGWNWGVWRLFYGLWRFIWRLRR